MAPLFELDISTAPRGSREVASHLYRQLKDAIVQRRLPAGARLPSTRESPRLFGVSRNTAQDVYDRLAQEGLVSARHGSGTYVCEVAREPRVLPLAVDAPRHGQVNSLWQRSDIHSWLHFWQERRGGGEETAVPPVADLRPALVDHQLFPHATFRQVMARQLRRLETRPAPARSAQGNQGNGGLRRAIAAHVGLTRAIACADGDIVVTSGAQQAFDLLARALVVPGETVVAVEDPGYPPMRVPFAAAGARIVAVPVDSDGIRVDRIPADAKIVCVCPSHQFPLGMPLSPRRRAELLDFARDSGALIVEDDYDGEFRYDGSPLQALRGGGSADHVAYVGSFSKCMFPSIRLGFVVAPPWALDAIVAVRNAADWHSPVPIQAAVSEFIRDGHLARHIRRVRRIYRRRRDRLIDLLEREAAQLLAPVPSFYGMHLAALADGANDCEAVSRSLARRGIMIHSLDRYFLGPATRSGFVLGFAAAGDEALDLAVAALAHELRSSGRG